MVSEQRLSTSFILLEFQVTVLRAIPELMHLPMNVDVCVVRIARMPDVYGVPWYIKYYDSDHSTVAH